VKRLLSNILKTALLGLVTIGVLAFVVEWLVRTVISLVKPLVHVLDATWGLSDYVAGTIVVAIIVAACFLIGVVVRTKVGAWILHAAEARLTRRAPGYVWIKDALSRLLGTYKPLFSSVALVEISSGTMTTAFVTDTHTDGSYTVFVPASPNPMTGSVYHIKPEHVHPLAVPVDVVWKSIVTCGAGSQELINSLHKEAGRTA